VTRSVRVDGTAEPGSGLAAGFLGGIHWLAECVETYDETFDAKAVFMSGRAATRYV
jgi:hypothetical protein